MCIRDSAEVDLEVLVSLPARGGRARASAEVLGDEVALDDATAAAADQGAETGDVVTLRFGPFSTGPKPGALVDAGALVFDRAMLLAAADEAVD